MTLASFVIEEVGYTLSVQYKKKLNYLQNFPVRTHNHDLSDSTITAGEGQEGMAGVWKKNLKNPHFFYKIPALPPRGNHCTGLKTTIRT
jgi:hypothetical protein